MNDPVKGCDVYKNVGCTHVDGFLCDYPNCSILKEYRMKTTYNLKDLIDTAKKSVYQTEQRLLVEKATLEKLESYRWECEHEFSPALKGYEHEGGHCTKCGINEVYWDCNKKYHVKG